MVGMTVRIGDVWDSTTDVLAGRARLLAPVAAVAFLLPSVLQSAVRLFGGASPGVAALVLLVGLIGLIAGLWGQLTVIAVASDPAATRADAGRLAAARLPADLLVWLVLGGLGLLTLVPFFVILAASGYDFAAAAAYKGVGDMPAMPAGALLPLTLYALALIVVLFWVGARLALVNAVVLNERRRLGAIARSWELTRGLTAKLIGVAMLFGIVFLIALTAAQAIVGLVFRLLLGPDQVTTALLMAAIAGALVTAAFTIVVQVFAARLYAAVIRGGSGASLA